jgi:hypothetical protein
MLVSTNNGVSVKPTTWQIITPASGARSQAIQLILYIAIPASVKKVVTCSR